MTATRKAPARRPRPRPELRMPYFYCVKPDCPYEYQPTGDYTDTAADAAAAGWLYMQGTGWLCPGDTGWVPWWPQPAGRLALPAPDVPRPGSERPAGLTGPGDPAVRVLPTVLVGGYHIPLDDEPLPDLPRPGPEGARDTGQSPGPGQPDATISFHATGETQPFTRPHPDHGKPFADLEREMARLDDAEDIQP